MWVDAIARSKEKPHYFIRVCASQDSLLL